MTDTKEDHLVRKSFLRLPVELVVSRSMEDDHIYNAIRSSTQWEAVPPGPGLNGVSDPGRVTWKLTPRKLTES